MLPMFTLDALVGGVGNVCARSRPGRPTLGCGARECCGGPGKWPAGIEGFIE